MEEKSFQVSGMLRQKRHAVVEETNALDQLTIEGKKMLSMSIVINNTLS